jgi:DNA repair ATPase RecN
MMNNFLRCLCYKDYSSLIKSGAPDKEELLSAWYLIISEYNELKKIDISESKYWSITQELTRLHNHLFLLQQCIDYLSFEYSEEVAKSLRSLGYRFKCPSKDPADYIGELYKVAEKAKTKYVQIQQYNKQLKDFLATQEGIEPDYATFETRLIAIEEMQHTVYDLETLSVSKFIALENKQRDMILALELKAARN